ncbi:MAG: phosphoserine phosphatase SerB [Paracoccaceae bacterium]
MSHVVVLTASPTIGLEDETIFEACQALEGVGAPRRLSASAAEIPVETFQQIEPVGLPVDANCVPLEGRRKKLLIADMDSTMIPVECIDEVADFAGVREQVVAITEPAMRGEISFEDALLARVALLKGLAAERLQDVYEARVNLNPGARTLVRTMTENGAYTALVSGGFTFFTERVAAAAGFHHNRANVLLFEDGKLNGKVTEPVLGRAAKIEALNELATAQGILLAEALAVGDGANDLGMIETAGLGVAFRAKPVVADAADCAIEYGDLTALLYLQGYSEADFVLD